MFFASATSLDIKASPALRRRIHRHYDPSSNRLYTKSGTPGRTRTYNKKIKSLLLYRLSYGGTREHLNISVKPRSSTR